MIATPQKIKDIILLEPKVFSDERGFFFESFNNKKFEEAIGRNVNFVQDNHSRSIKGVLRGLHYQSEKPQGKLVRVIQGEIFDVAVDIRRDSKTYGQWIGANLSSDNKCQLWIPEGFAHGFQVLSESAEILYKTTDYYAPEYEHCILWNDPSLNIEWPYMGSPILSDKDKAGVTFSEAKSNAVKI